MAASVANLTCWRKLGPIISSSPRLHPCLMAANAFLHKGIPSTFNSLGHSHHFYQQQQQQQQQQHCSIQAAIACLSSHSDPPFNAQPSILVVISFYKFAHLPDYQAKRQPLKDLCEELRVSGGIILAEEGINGSICGTRDAVQKVLEHIQSDERLANLRQTESPATDEEVELHHGHTSKSPLAAADDAPFRWGHVRIKLKNEIVTLGVDGVSPTKQVGRYVKPKDWNAFIRQPGTMVVDVRNSYEIRIGKFRGAVDPETDSFREFPLWVEKRLSGPTANSQTDMTPSKLSTHTPQRVAMYCTGGIRCEKATSLLMSKGFTEVYHLEGGILKYLEDIPPAESMWEGECFVFDKRVSVEHGLKPGTYKLCYACKKPVSDEDMLSKDWEDGVSCPYCIHTKSEKEKERARARQRQFELWGAVGGPNKGRHPVPLSQKGSAYSDLRLSKSV